MKEGSVELAIFFGPNAREHAADYMDLRCGLLIMTA
jgi:hypothetical protein